jgi:hypothetical protein
VVLVGGSKENIHSNRATTKPPPQILRQKGEEKRKLTIWLRDAEKCVRFLYVLRNKYSNYLHFIIVGVYFNQILWKQ